MKKLILIAALAFAVSTAFADDTINDIQDGTIAPGTAVSVEGVVIYSAPGEFSGAFCFVNEPGAGAYSGVKVYWSSAREAEFAGLARGDLVDITGVTLEYFDETEIDVSDTLDTVVKVGTSAISGPDNVDLPWTEPWEGCFVVTNCTQVTVLQNQYYEWEVTDHTGSGLCDDATAAYLSYVPAIGDARVIQGALGYSFGAYKLQPREDADITACQWTSTDAMSWGGVKALFQ